MSNKESVQEIEKNLMTIKIPDNKENKNILKKVLTNRKVIMMNLIKKGKIINFLHLKMRKNQSRIIKSRNKNNLEVR